MKTVYSLQLLIRPALLLYHYQPSGLCHVLVLDPSATPMPLQLGILTRSLIVPPPLFFSAPLQHFVCKKFR